MKGGGDDAAGDGVIRGRDAEEEDDFGSEETDTEVDMDDIPLRLDLLADEYGDGEEHADDGDGEADIGDEVEVRVVHGHGVLVDVEDEGEVGEVAAGAHGVAAVVTHCLATVPRPKVIGKTPEGAGDVVGAIILQEEGVLFLLSVNSKKLVLKQNNNFHLKIKYKSESFLLSK